MRLIDADELLDKIGEPNERSQKIFMQRDVIKIINNMPVIEQKHGHWELKRRIADVNWWSCSICGRISEKGRGLKTTPYCQYCGAKMDEVTEDDG